MLLVVVDLHELRDDVQDVAMQFPLLVLREFVIKFVIGCWGIVLAIVRNFGRKVTVLVGFRWLLFLRYNRLLLLFLLLLPLGLLL